MKRLELPALRLGLGPALALALSVTAAACAPGSDARIEDTEDVAGAVAPVVMAALIVDVEQAEEKLVGLAEAIPEEDYGWRPAAGVRSIGEVMRHVAADNYLLPAFVDVAPPAATGISGTDYATVQAYEARQLDKATTVRELSASFAHLKDAMRGVDDEALADVVTFFGTEMSGLELWVLTTTHLHEHLGQSIAYARGNGVVPPWSRPAE